MLQPTPAEDRYADAWLMGKLLKKSNHLRLGFDVLRGGRKVCQGAVVVQKQPQVLRLQCPLHQLCFAFELHDRFRSRRGRICCWKMPCQVRPCRTRRRSRKTGLFSIQRKIKLATRSTSASGEKLTTSCPPISFAAGTWVEQKTGMPASPASKTGMPKPSRWLGMNSASLTRKSSATMGISTIKGSSAFGPDS